MSSLNHFMVANSLLIQVKAVVIFSYFLLLGYWLHPFWIHTVDGARSFVYQVQQWRTGNTL